MDKCYRKISIRCVENLKLLELFKPYFSKMLFFVYDSILIIIFNLNKRYAIRESSKYRKKWIHRVATFVSLQEHLTNVERIWIRRLMKSEPLEKVLSDREFMAQNCVKAVIENVLGIHRSENWFILIDLMLNAFHRLTLRSASTQILRKSIFILIEKENYWHA